MSEVLSSTFMQNPDDDITRREAAQMGEEENPTYVAIHEKWQRTQRKIEDQGFDADERRVVPSLYAERPAYLTWGADANGTKGEKMVSVLTLNAGVTSEPIALMLDGKRVKSATENPISRATMTVPVAMSDGRLALLRVPLDIGWNDFNEDEVANVKAQVPPQSLKALGEVMKVFSAEHHVNQPLLSLPQRQLIPDGSGYFIGPTGSPQNWRLEMASTESQQSEWKGIARAARELFEKKVDQCVEKREADIAAKNAAIIAKEASTEPVLGAPYEIKVDLEDI